MSLVFNTSFQKSVRQEASLYHFYKQYSKETIQEAIILIKTLDSQRIVNSPTTIENNYKAVLHKILFNS